MYVVLLVGDSRARQIDKQYNYNGSNNYGGSNNYNGNAIAIVVRL